MVKSPIPTIAASACDTTQPCIATSKTDLETTGFQVRTFQDSPEDTTAIEQLIASGTVADVLDLTLFSPLKQKLTPDITVIESDHPTFAHLRPPSPTFAHLRAH